MVNMPRAFQNHQSIAGCSNFFNLKPNAGTKNILQFQHAKIGRDFLVQVPTSQTSKELAVGKKNKNRKVYGKCNRKVYLFKMRNLPSAL